MGTLAASGAVRQGENNKDKLSYIFNEYRNLMLNKAYNILKDREQAEEALFNSFAHIRKNIKLIDDPAGSRSIVFATAVAKCCAYAMTKRAMPERKFYQSNNDFSVRKLENALAEMSAYDISAAVNRLGGLNRNIFILTYVYGASIRRVSRILGEAEAVTAWRLQTAQRKLCALLSGGGF